MAGVPWNDGLAVRPMKARQRDKGQIDMDENQFWAVIWKCATVAFVVAVATLGSCSVHKQRVVEHMVEMGNDPIKAHCSMYVGNAENNSICAIVAMPK